MKFTIDQRNDFSRLIEVSRLTDRRRPLCLQIGLDPSNLDYLQNRVAIDFAIELISDCEKKELDGVLVRLLTLVNEELRGSKKYQETIAGLYKALGVEVPSAGGVKSESTVLADGQYEVVKVF